MKNINEKSLKMRDISSKEVTLRTAYAAGFINVSKAILERIKTGDTPKGDVITLAKAAGIAASKQVPFLIPMCHNIALAYCEIDCDIQDDGIYVNSEVKAFDRTGVEMEALTVVSITLLNIYDMLKPLDKSMEIKSINLLKKTGGKSGDYVRQD